MNQAWLKKIRVVVSLVFLALTTLLFVDFDRIGETPAATAALYPQFVPSLLKFSQTITWGAAGFLAVLVLTLLFGRVYCSTICPLGTLQDIVIRVADRLRKPRKVKFRYQRSHDVLRYGVLALVVGLFLSGSTLALSLLDPFSNFGRIAGDLIRPFYVVVHNGFGQLLESFGVYGPFPLHWKAPPLAALIFPALFFARADRVERRQRPAVLQHPLSGGRVAGAGFPFRPVQDPHSPGCLRAVRPVLHSLQGRLYPAENQGSGFQSLRGLFQLYDRVRDARHRLCVVGAGTIASPKPGCLAATATVEFPRHRASCRLVQGREGTTGVAARGCDGAGWVGESASVIKRRSQAEQPCSHSIGQRQDLAGGAARRP
jgi:hypothetical protein